MNYVMLKDVCAINMGQSPDSKSYNDTGDGVPFFQGNADFGARYPVTRKWCSEPTKMAAPNDILISVRAPIGAMNYARENCCIGRGLAALTPVIVEASHKGNHFKFAKIARIFGGVTAEDLAGKLRSLLKDIDLACTLSDLGLSEEDIPWMAENCMKVSAASIQNNPVVFTQEEIAEIYRKAM